MHHSKPVPFVSRIITSYAWRAASAATKSFLGNASRMSMPSREALFLFCSSVKWDTIETCGLYRRGMFQVEYLEDASTARARFAKCFRLACIYEITRLLNSRQANGSSCESQGRFPMETFYTWHSLSANRDPDALAESRLSIRAFRVGRAFHGQFDRCGYCIS